MLVRIPLTAILVCATMAIWAFIAKAVLAPDAPDLPEPSAMAATAEEPAPPTPAATQATFSGVVSTTLWDAAKDEGMDAELVQRLTDLFAWQVDFSQEVGEDDRFRLVVERNGDHWGRILAAEYESQGTRHTALLFTDASGASGYYRPDGTSVRQAFLRSPLRYSRITSPFQSRRLHPILNVVRPHLGVDYAAPMGTPVLAVADGVVDFAGWKSGGGRSVEIEHGSAYATAYRHLSRLAPGIRPGARVNMGDTIGFVGMSGLATGPHLHYELKVDGQIVNPLSIHAHVHAGVPDAELRRFFPAADDLMSQLPPWRVTPTAE